MSLRRASSVLTRDFVGRRVKRLDVAFRLDVELRVACSSRRGRFLVIV